MLPGITLHSGGRDRDRAYPYPVHPQYIWCNYININDLYDN